MGPRRQEQIFLDDTYRMEVTSEICAHGATDHGTWIATWENIFHPQGGGQPADTGSVNGLPVSPRWSREVEGQVELVLDADEEALAAVGLRVGTPVALAIDTERRLSYAALHSAGHLVDAAIRRRGFRHLVSNHFPDEARIEFAADGRTDDLDVLWQEIQKEVEEAIGAGVAVATSTDADGRRVVSIGSYSTDVCGGTHVRNSAQLTNFSIRSVKIKKGRLKVGYTVEHVGD